MPWSRNLTKPTPAACVSWTSDSGNDNIYPCVNGINDGKYGYNNLQMLVTTWYHKFTDKWHMATEGWYMWERDVPSVLEPNQKFIVNANGAVCAPGRMNCLAPEYAIVNYQLYQLSPKDYLTFRNEVFHDLRGQRTGFKTLYSEHLLGWTHWIGDVLTIRPEVRFERSYQTPAYDNAGRKNQFTLATDVVFHY